MKTTDNPLARLRHHVTGAIERGEKTPIVAQDKTTDNKQDARSNISKLSFYMQRTDELLKQVMGLTVQRDAAKTETIAVCKLLTAACQERDAAVAALRKLAGKREGLPLSHEITCHGLNFIPNCSEREEQCDCGHAQARAVIAAAEGNNNKQ